MMIEESTLKIDLSIWTRLREVQNYAYDHGMSTSDAIRELVNSGLSHEPESYV